MFIFHLCFKTVAYLAILEVYGLSFLAHSVCTMSFFFGTKKSRSEDTRDKTIYAGALSALHVNIRSLLLH